MRQICSSDGRFAVNYEDVQFIPIFTVAATQAAFDKLDQLRKQFDDCFEIITGRSRPKLFTDIIVASLSRETRNPIIPSTNLDFTDFHAYSPSWIRLREALRKDLILASEGFDAHNFTDDRIASFSWINQTGQRYGYFAALDADGNTVGDLLCCSVRVYNTARCRWKLNKKLRTHFRREICFKKAMYLLLLRYTRMYRKRPLNNLATHPVLLDAMVSDQQQVIGCEVCGSVLNAHLSVYGSLFYDLEKYFGSIGSAAFIQPISGVFTVDLLPSEGVFLQLMRKQWFFSVSPDSDLHVYLKIQGFWGTENKFLSRWSSDDFRKDFQNLLLDRNMLSHVERRYILWDCLRAQQLYHRRWNHDDPCDILLQQLKSSMQFAEHRFFKTGEFAWMNHLQDTAGRWDSEMAVYLLSTNQNSLILPHLLLPAVVETQSLRKRQFEQKNNETTINFCRRYLDYWFPVVSPTVQQEQRRFRLPVMIFLRFPPRNVTDFNSQSCPQ